MSTLNSRMRHQVSGLIELYEKDRVFLENRINEIKERENNPQEVCALNSKLEHIKFKLNELKAY